jgi:hypothetical protein
MAVAFEHYGQTVATAAPPQQARAPQPQPAAYVPPQASTAAAPQAAARHSDRLLRGSAYLLLFAGLLFLAAFLIAVTPLGRIDADITVPFLAVFVGGLGAIVWAVLR